MAPRLPPPGPPLLELKKNVVPLLQGEIIRLRKESIVSDTDSNSDVDIGDDECGQKKPKMAAQPLQPLPPSTVSPAPPPTPPVPVHHEESEDIYSTDHLFFIQVLLSFSTAWKKRC